MHPQFSRRSVLGSLLALPLSTKAQDDWIPLFNGRSLDGWKPSENTASFSVKDGFIAADGPRSHLFYAGPLHNADFKNFELQAEILTKPLCNSGIYFHTAFQPSGFPARGFEIQINNTYTGEGNYLERKKTASLYAIRDIYKAFANDDEWFKLHIAVRGKQVQVRLNGTLLVDYIEPSPPVTPPHMDGRFLDRGTFALQCHNNGSRAFFRNILVKPLPGDAAPNNPDHPVADQLFRDIVRLNAENYPLVDYHVHLKGGLTIDGALRESRRAGIQYGVAVNCGLGFPVQDDAGASAFLQSMKDQPVFVGLQGEGREWPSLLSKETRAKFDYVFTDSMTVTTDNGKRIHLWINDEVPPIEDRQRFMDMCVDRTVAVLNNEPIDIYANPTFLPDAIAPAYDELWTTERIAKVVEAARKRGIAIEINNRYRLPHAPFIRAAKQAGLKFSFGTNNAGAADLGRLEYPIVMVKECGLTWRDIFVPRDKPAASSA